MLKTAKGEWSRKAGKKLVETIVKHPRSTLAAGGATLGGGLGYGNSKIDNWAEGLGKSDQTKKKLEGKNKERTKAQTLGGALAGGGIGLWHGHQFAKSHIRQSALKKTHVPKWAKGAKTKAEVKSKMRSEARKHHPDLGGNEEKMKKLNTEWEDFEKSDNFKKMSSLLPSFWDELARINP